MLDPERMEAEVEEILTLADICRPPIHLRRVCAALDVRLFRDGHDEYGHRVFQIPLPDHVHGLLLPGQFFHVLRFRVRRPDGSPTPATRQRFTIAHELAHLRLHVGSDEYGYFTDGPHYEETSEREANLLAAALLMPERFLRASIDAGETFDAMRDVFWVSRPALKQRLRDLSVGTDQGGHLHTLPDVDDVSIPTSHIRWKRRPMRPAGGVLPAP